MKMEIPKPQELEKKVFSILNDQELSLIALQVYHFQFHSNPVYGAYCNLVHRTPGQVSSADKIPFLPIGFFKSRDVVSTEFKPEIIFQSSGTTASVVSRHLIKDASLYERSFVKGFNARYGAVENYCILGLLPSYLENANSSLVYMIDNLIKRSGHPYSGFYLKEYDKLYSVLNLLENSGQKTILIGVTYALLDFALSYNMKLTHTTIMETGGMKGRRDEIVKTELYQLLQNSFGNKEIHAEYGMTELLSQAYGVNGKLRTPPWMKVILRDETDPFSITDNPHKMKNGAINIIDMANLYSCSFIATDDLGSIYPDKSFEVLGRMDHTDVRGCSQLAL